MPTQHRLDVSCEIIIPQRLKWIAAGKKMIALERKYKPLSMIHVMVEMDDHSQVCAYQEVLTALTQPTIDIAVVHSRCLLEFLGLGVDGKAKPPTLSKDSRNRRSGDVGIEHFVSTTGPLHRLKPNEAAALIGKSDTVSVAWATVIVIANQRMAHSTDDDTLTGTDIQPLLEVAFDTVPELVCTALYDQIGKARPSY
jgi:hypothetical protein